jgi:uncharacterized membrane protein YsdA (DUF1294 family)
MLRTVLIAIAVINVLTFLLFGWDKWCARRDRRRIPEAWLIGMTFATGLVGAWFAMSLFRHKTRKVSFRVKAIAVSIFNLAWLVAWLWWRGDLA